MIQYKQGELPRNLGRVVDMGNKVTPIHRKLELSEYDKIEDNVYRHQNSNKRAKQPHHLL